MRVIALGLFWFVVVLFVLAVAFAPPMSLVVSARFEFFALLAICAAILAGKEKP